MLNFLIFADCLRFEISLKLTLKSTTPHKYICKEDWDTMEEEIKELKSVLRSLVVSSPTQVDVRTLMRDYHNMVGKLIPLGRYGYKEPVQFLKERCSDCFLFTGQPGNPVLTLIVPDTLKHIDKFVQKQRVSTTHKFKEKRKSIPAAVPPPSNLISKTFVKKQTEKIASLVLKETKTPQDSKGDDDVQSDGTNKENEVEQGCKSTPRGSLDYFMKKRIPLHNNSQGLRTEESFRDRDSSQDDTDSSQQTSSSPSSDSSKWTQLENLKTEIKNLIGDYPEGIWCTELIGLYRERHGRELNFSRFGYTSVLSLACVLEDALRIWRPHGASDWRLCVTGAAPPAAPPPAAPPRRVYASVDLDDALPGIDFDSDVFPEDCMHFMESIPMPSLEGLQVGATLEVIVGEVYSPSHFWLIRLGAQHSVAMEDVMDEMTEYYTRGGGRERYLARGAVRVGQYCSSCYEGDWHRSLIVKLIDSDTVKVRHVDYGTVERCAVSALRPLPRRWAALPQQAVRARLAALRPPAAGRRWPRAAAAHLLRAVTQRHLVAQLVARLDDILEVVLVDTTTDEDICINTEMTRAGHADPRDDSCLGTSECYLYPSFEALESGDTPNYAEIHRYLRDGIALEYVEDFRRHVPPCLPGTAPPPGAALPPRAPSPTPDLLAALEPGADHGPQSHLASLYPATTARNLLHTSSNRGELSKPLGRVLQTATVLPCPSRRPPLQPAPRPLSRLCDSRFNLVRSDLDQHHSSQQHSPTPFRDTFAFLSNGEQNISKQPPPKSTHGCELPAPGPGPPPRTDITLSASDCEIFCLLSQVNPDTAHRYMIDAIRRAMAAKSTFDFSSLNPEAAEFYTRAVFRQNAPQAPAAPRANLGDFSSRFGPITTHPVIRFIGSLPPDAGTRPPPGFEKSYRR